MSKVLWRSGMVVKESNALPTSCHGRKSRGFVREDCIVFTINTYLKKQARSLKKEPEIAPI
jgi:hypothetical protein